MTSAPTKVNDLKQQVRTVEELRISQGITDDEWGTLLKEARCQPNRYFEFIKRAIFDTKRPWQKRLN